MRKMLLMGEGDYRVHVENSCHEYQRAFKLMIADTMKVLAICLTNE